MLPVVGSPVVHCHGIWGCRLDPLHPSSNSSIVLHGSALFSVKYKDSQGIDAQSLKVQLGSTSSQHRVEWGPHWLNPGFVRFL